MKKFSQNNATKIKITQPTLTNNVDYKNINFISKLQS